MTALDALRARRAELAKHLDVLDRITVFVDALRAECGIEAEIETDDGDVILCIPQIVPPGPVAVSEPPVRERQEPLPPAPEPQRAPTVPEAKPQPAPAGPALSRHGMPWDESDDERIVAGVLAGMRAPEIAADLRRTTAAVTYRIANALRDRVADARKARLRKPSAPAAAPPPQQSGSPGWLRDLRARLDALGNVAPWTPAADCALAESILSGATINAAAEACGVTPQQARERWRSLLPEPGIDAQARLIAELRARAAGAQEAA